METMCSLQEAVAASRLEIVASQADNEELRGTNEELRRSLQQAGERAVDERAPPINDDETTMLPYMTDRPITLKLKVDQVSKVNSWLSAV